MSSIPTTVIRHPRERVSKCSLRFLHDRPEMTFLRGKPGFQFEVTGFTLLAVDGESLSPADGDRPLLLFDSTWRWLPQLLECVVGDPVLRSIPGGVQTAYPRTSKLWDDFDAGLVLIEVLYFAW